MAAAWAAPDAVAVADVAVVAVVAASLDRGRAVAVRHPGRRLAVRPLEGPQAADPAAAPARSAAPAASLTRKPAEAPVGRT
jgi:hypothetical protein